MKPDSGNIFSDAKAYEAYVGRWSRLVAPQFITWLRIAGGHTWLDVGAGTGVLTQAILQHAAPAKVVGVDLSADYVELARQNIQDNRVEFRVADAAKIVYDAPPFDAAVAGLVLNFVPDYQQAVRNMVQAVRNGGTVAAYVWDYTDKMEMMRYFWDIAQIIDPTAAEMEAVQCYSICNPNSLRSLFEAAGLNAVEVAPIDVPTHFKDFDDYWLPFLGAQGSVAKYLRGLSDETRNTIRDHLQQRLPTTSDGGIALVARAWAVKGKREISA